MLLQSHLELGVLGANILRIFVVKKILNSAFSMTMLISYNKFSMTILL
jgi:hypothetical protein